jgi:hypothetical protein
LDFDAPRLPAAARRAPRGPFSATSALLGALLAAGGLAGDLGLGERHDQVRRALADGERAAHGAGHEARAAAEQRAAVDADLRHDELAELDLEVVAGRRLRGEDDLAEHRRRATGLELEDRERLVHGLAAHEVGDRAGLERRDPRVAVDRRELLADDADKAAILAGHGRPPTSCRRQRAPSR